VRGTTVPLFTPLLHHQPFSPHALSLPYFFPRASGAVRREPCITPRAGRGGAQRAALQRERDARVPRRSTPLARAVANLRPFLSLPHSPHQAITMNLYRTLVVLLVVIFATFNVVRADGA
jgi:hypothetical protein